jgi:hypothetical protein
MSTETWGNHVAIVVEGVLRMPNDSAAIIPGLLLYRSLVKTHRITLIFDSSDKKKISYWLLMNGFTDHTGEIYWDVEDSDDVAVRRISQIGRIRQEGPLSLVIESDMNAASALLEAGVPSFLFLHPQYIHPDFLPGKRKEVTPWDQLYAETVRQREARATDTRIKDF